MHYFLRNWGCFQITPNFTMQKKVSWICPFIQTAKVNRICSGPRPILHPNFSVIPLTNQQTDEDGNMTSLAEVMTKRNQYMQIYVVAHLLSMSSFTCIPSARPCALPVHGVLSDPVLSSRRHWRYRMSRCSSGERFPLVFLHFLRRLPNNSWQL